MRINKNLFYTKEDYTRHRDGFFTTFQPLRLVFNSLDYICVENEYNYPEHIHKSYELILPVQGEYECELNGEKLGVEQDEILIVQYSDRHSDYYHLNQKFIALILYLRDFNNQPWEHGIIHPDLPMGARILRLSSGSPSELVRRSLVSLIEPTESNPFLAIEALGKAFFWMVMQSLPDHDLSIPFQNCLHDSLFRRKLFDLFAKSLNKQLNMNDLALELGISIRSLEYKCRKVLGTSPARAFVEYKIKESILMLESGKSVKETAECLGFADPFHFSKVFKRVMKTPPSQVIR